MRRLTSDDFARVAEAIRQAETRTSGEIFCVVSDRPERYYGAAATWAAVAAFTFPLIAILLGFQPWSLIPEWSDGPPPSAHVAEAFLAVQLATFFAVLALIGWTPLERLMTPKRVRRSRLHRIALDQFLARGLHHTADRTGVLVFLNVPEQYAEVIADQAIYAKVSPDHWAACVAELIRSAKAGDIGGGFVRAVGLAGDVLAAHFPPGALNPNEIPDALVQM
jgi:putative membrane protein